MFDPVELTEHTEKIASLDEHICTDADLIAGTLAIAEAIRHLDAAQGALLAELDARGTTDIIHGHRTHTWLTHQTGIAPSSAKRKVRLANTLRRDLPGTNRAVRDGRLCTDRAHVMANAVNERILHEFRQMEESLIAESAHMTFAQWAQRVHLVAELLDHDGPEPSDDITNNRLRLQQHGDTTRLGGTLVGDLAVTTRHAIDTVADELLRQYTTDNDHTCEIAVPSRDTLRALAFAELCRRGLMVNHNGHATKPRTEATLVITLEEPDTVFVDGQPLVRGSASALACDISVYTIILNSLGVPLDMGREIRTANRAQRRALNARDGGCVFPGCETRPEHCDAHHIAQWWRDLGTTDVHHMVFLCRHHHRVIHRTGWSIRLDDHGHTWITTPSGITLAGQRHRTTHSGAPPGLAA